MDSTQAQQMLQYLQQLVTENSVTNYIVNSASGAFTVFQTFTYGEMVQSFLLLLILLVLVFRWIYEVIR